MRTNKEYGKKIRFGVVGLLGYSRSHIGQILLAQNAGEPVELTAVVAFMREKNEKLATELEEKGVKLVSDYDKLLEMKNDIDCITLPVGIPLHTSMGIKALEAGFPVYLEKPVSGAIQDADALALSEKKSGKKLFIGYQLCFKEATWELKKRLASGDIGTIKKIVVVAEWPRTKAYFNRNAWAGKLSINNTIVLDSPLNNACAHYINLPLFLVGKEMELSGVPISVESELYRANDIESTDTLSIRIKTEEGVEIVWIASHACEKGVGPKFRIEGSKKTVNADFATKEKTWYEGASGEGEIFLEDKWGPLNPFVSVAKWLQGEKEVPVCDLKIARAQTVVVNGAHQAPIVDIPKKYVKEISQNDGDILVAVDGMNQLLDKCYQEGALISETSSVEWSQKPTVVDVRGLKFFKLPNTE